MFFRWYPIFIAFWFSIMIYFAIPVIKQIYHNSYLTSSVKPKSAHWSIREVHDEKWVPEVKYTFEANGLPFDNEETFRGYSYRNPYAAKDSLQEIISTHPLVWYSQKDPKNSTMEKFFPKKQATYAGIIFLLFLYFNYGLYVFLRQGEKWKK